MKEAAYKSWPSMSRNELLKELQRVRAALWEEQQAPAPAPCVCGHTHKDGNGPCMVCSTCIYTPSKIKDEAPAPVDAVLVEKAIDAYLAAKEAAINGGSSWMNEAMTAALRVAADVLLRGATTAEIDAAKRAYDEFMRVSGPNTTDHSVLREALKAALQNFLNGRARLLAPAKTPEERVTVGRVDACSHVYLDGKWQESFSNNEHAEIYRLGLIATLKEGK